MVSGGPARPEVRPGLLRVLSGVVGGRDHQPLGVPRPSTPPTSTGSSASAPTSSRRPCSPPTARHLPDAGRPRRDGLVVAGPAGHPAARRACASPARCAASCGGTRCGSTPPSTTWSRLRRPRRPTAGSPGDPARLRGACTTSAGPTASRRGTATASSSGGLYGVAIGGLFAGESMFHRPPTPRRSRSSASSSCCDAGGRRCSTCSGTPTTSSRLGAVEIPRRALPRAGRPPTPPLPLTCCAGRPPPRPWTDRRPRTMRGSTGRAPVVAASETVPG